MSIATDDHPYVAVCAFGKAEIVREDRDKWMERFALRYGEEDVKGYLARSVVQPDRVVMASEAERLPSWHYGRGDSKRQDDGESMATHV